MGFGGGVGHGSPSPPPAFTLKDSVLFDAARATLPADTASPIFPVLSEAFIAGVADVPSNIAFTSQGMVTVSSIANSGNKTPRWLSGPLYGIDVNVAFPLNNPVAPSYPGLLRLQTKIILDIRGGNLAAGEMMGFMLAANGNVNWTSGAVANAFRERLFVGYIQGHANLMVLYDDGSTVTPYDMGIGFSATLSYLVDFEVGYAGSTTIKISSADMSAGGVPYQSSTLTVAVNGLFSQAALGVGTVLNGTTARPGCTMPTGLVRVTSGFSP